MFSLFKLMQYSNFIYVCIFWGLYNHLLASLHITRYLMVFKDFFCGPSSACWCLLNCFDQAKKQQQKLSANKYGESGTKFIDVVLCV